MIVDRLRRRFRPDDRAAAGTVAGLIMLGAIVAFLAYMNATWVPAWTESKESNHANDVADAMQTWATDAEDHVARSQTGRSWSVPFGLGVGGLLILGTGASSGELAVASGPTLTLMQGATLVAYAQGGVAMTTHTLRFPNQTITYGLGALQIAQSDGAWVDLRSMLSVNRTTSGKLDLTVQLVNLSASAQQAGGNGQALATGKVTSIATATGSAGSIVLNVTGVQGGAWRAALNRTLTANGLAGETAASCAASTKDYCYATGDNTASAVSLTLLNVKSGWSAQTALLAAEIRT